MTPRTLPSYIRTPGPTRDLMLRRAEDRVAGVLDDLVRRDPHAATLADGLDDCLRADTERLRPVILFTGFLAAGGDPASEDAVTAAAALEFLDVWQTLRDDVRENAVLRRGAPTTHIRHAAEHERNGWRGEARRYGELTAALTGDLVMACGDRLAARLPEPAADLWQDLRTERVLGAQAEADAATEYLGDPWPARCLSGCSASCGAGWYALRHPLLMGAALAGRPDLAAGFAGYAAPLHAAWRLRGFLDDGPGYDADAQFLREAVFGARGRQEAEDLISDLVSRAMHGLRGVELARGWYVELAALALRLAGTS